MFVGTIAAAAAKLTRALELKPWMPCRSLNELALVALASRLSLITLQFAAPCRGEAARPQFRNELHRRGLGAAAQDRTGQDPWVLRVRRDATGRTAGSRMSRH